MGHVAPMVITGLLNKYSMYEGNHSNQFDDRVPIDLTYRYRSSNNLQVPHTEVWVLKQSPQ